MTEKEVKNMIRDIFFSTPVVDNTYTYTGRNGAINFENSLREAVSVSPLTKEEEDKFQEGMYRISTEKGLEFLGAFESE